MAELELVLVVVSLTSKPAGKPGSVTPAGAGATIIYLGRQLPAASSGLPEAQMGRAIPLPLLGLAPGGGYLAARVTTNAGGLLHHLFTITLFPALPHR
jgi:hypothetical protein